MLTVDKRIIQDSIQIDKTYKKDLQKKTLELYANTEWRIDEFFNSGHILFGDTISSFVNRVAKNIIRSNPELNNFGFKFYGYKSSSVNAVSFCNGVILVNTGLIAYLNNEAELAFVLSHEMAHYVEKHGLNSVVDRYNIEQEYKNDKKKYKSNSSYENYIDKLFRSSKQHEFQADSLGLIFYSHTDYNRKSPAALLEILHRSDVSYETLPISKSFFSLKDFEFSSDFFLDSVNKIMPIEDENDRYYTHPNTKKRIDQYEELQSKLNFDGNELNQIVTSKEFDFIKEVARFEQIRLHLLKREYGDAIYEAYGLLKKHPNNKYLAVSIAKAYYGLAKYKTADEFHRVARSYTSIEGESQQIHHLLKQTDRKQLNVYAYKQIKEVYKKYPENKTLKVLMDDLVKDLVVENQQKLDDLIYTDKDKGNSRKSYKLLLIDELKDTSFTNQVTKNYPLLDKKKKDDLIPFEKLEEQKTEEDLERKKKGAKLFVKDLVVCNPSIYELNKKGEIELEKCVSDYHITCNGVIESAARNKIKITLLDNKYVTLSGATNYNFAGRLNEWAEERFSHGTIGVLPVTSDIVKQSLKNFNSNYICFISIYISDKIGRAFYEIKLYNVNTGKEEFSFEHIGASQLKERQLRKLVDDFFETIQK